MKVVAYLTAVVLFALAGFGAHAGGLGALDLIAFGLATFAAGHLIDRL